MTGRIVQLGVSPGGVPKTRVTAARVGVTRFLTEGEAARLAGPTRA